MLEDSSHVCCLFDGLLSNLLTGQVVEKECFNFAHRQIELEVYVQTSCNLLKQPGNHLEITYFRIEKNEFLLY